MAFTTRRRKGLLAQLGLTLPAVAGMEESVLAKKRVATTTAGAEAIGQRLAAFRKARGITQVELAQRLDISQAVVSRYEKGDLLLHGELIAQLAAILRVTTDALLGVERTKAKGTTVAPPSVDRGLARRMAQLQGLPRRDRDAILRTLDAFLAAKAAA